MTCEDIIEANFALSIMTSLNLIEANYDFP